MNYTDVDADRVLKTKTQITNDIAGMARIRDLFKNQIISALDPSWRGIAKDSFTSQWRVFAETFESFIKDCEKLNNELERTARGYNIADGEARRLVTNLPV